MDFFVRTHAENIDVWNLVDSSHYIKPACLTPPKEPTIAIPESGAVDPAAVERYKLQMMLYKLKLVHYKEQKKAIGI